VLLSLVLLAGAAEGQRARSAKKPKKRAQRVARVLPPTVVDSFRTIILTTCPEEEEGWEAPLREELARWVNVRYRRAGTTMSGADCSGFIKTVFRSTLSLELPRSAAAQALLGTPVEKRELRFGDLLFFRAKKRIDHVGIYIGEGYFIHSSRTHGVRIDSLFGSPYYTKRYARARRILSLASNERAGSAPE
jgi:cell wall-associated NlpC family hydrolase